MEDEEPAREDGDESATAQDGDATAPETPDGVEGGDGQGSEGRDGDGGRHTFGPPDSDGSLGGAETSRDAGDRETEEATDAADRDERDASSASAAPDDDAMESDPTEGTEPTGDGDVEDGEGSEDTVDETETAATASRADDAAATSSEGRSGTDEASPEPADVGGGQDATVGAGATDDDDAGGPTESGAAAGAAATAAAQEADEATQAEGQETAEATEAAEDAAGDEAPGDASDAPDRVAKYDRFKKIESSEYDRVNDFLRKRTYITAREWAIARLCSDFRTETGVEMTLIGENLPELIPFMTDEYSPQAVNQARASFRDKVKKAGSTFLYGSMSGFFTTEELDDVMYEVTETARFLLEVEGAEIAAEHEMEVEDRISDAMREIQDSSEDLRREETEHTCPHCGSEFTEDEEP
mgnify:CR=1 FL=1